MIFTSTKRLQVQRIWRHSHILQIFTLVRSSAIVHDFFMIDISTVQIYQSLDLFGKPLGHV